MHTIIVNNCEPGDTVVRLTRNERKLVCDLLNKERRVAMRVSDLHTANEASALDMKIMEDKEKQEGDDNQTI